MSTDEFTKLFTYMQREFKRIDARLDQMASKESVEILTNAVDAFAKRDETCLQELLALGHIVDRHDGWIHQVAKVSNTRLSA